MKLVPLPSRSFHLAALLSLSGAPVALLLPGCSGGSSNALRPKVTQTRAFVGTVLFDTTQQGFLNVQTFSDSKATGTLTIVTLPPVVLALKAQATNFALGTYNLSGTVDPVDGTVLLTGNLSGFGPFSVRVTPPTSTSAGSFTTTFGSESYVGSIPVTSPTPSPTASATPVATATPTTGPTATPTAGGGGVPLGSGPLTISLTSSNSTLSGGNILNGIGSMAAVDQIGNAHRINLVVSNNSLPPTLFNFLVSKSSPFAAGDGVTITGDAGTADLITLLVTNLSNPANSDSFRGQSGNFKIDSIAGKKVSFTISNLAMVSQTSSASFNLNGSGSFTIQ